jgi:hypothetical protein
MDISDGGPAQATTIRPQAHKIIIDFYICHVLSHMYRSYELLAELSSTLFYVHYILHLDVI